MSTRDDARLTAEERAALSNLEALAAADDPQLAARLRGPRRWSMAVHRARVRTLTLRGRPPAWLDSLRVAVPAVVLGLALVVAGVILGVGVGVLGALICACGLVVGIRDARRRFRAGRRSGPGGGS